jgi:hypothetical protein
MLEWERFQIGDGVAWSSGKARPFEQGFAIPA